MAFSFTKCLNGKDLLTTASDISLAFPQSKQYYPVVPCRCWDCLSVLNNTAGQMYSKISIPKEYEGSTFIPALH